MTTIICKIQCFACSKKSIYYCRECFIDLCSDHFKKHCQKFYQEFHEIQYNYNQFRQLIIQENYSNNHDLFIEEINQWENDSIQKIKQKANECRDILVKSRNNYTSEIKNNLNKLTDEIKKIRHEDHLNELDLNELKIKLQELAKEFNNLPNISIKKESTSFINNISLIISQKIKIFNNINLNTRWKQDGITIAGGNGNGDKLNQLSEPQGIYVDDDQTIYIADWWNNRIIAWKSNAENGEIVAGGNGNGSRIDQLCRPTYVMIDKQNNSIIICDSGNRRVVRWSLHNHMKREIIISDIDCCSIAMDKNGNIYVSDTRKSQVKRWKIGEIYGTIIAGGDKPGKCLNQLNFPSYIYVDDDYSVYISDDNNHRVMKWMKDAKQGIIVAGGNSDGNQLRQLYYPQGMTVDHLGNIYVADFANQRVMRWRKEAIEGDIIVGGNGEGNLSNQFNYLRGLAFDQQGNLYIVDSKNHRIQKFQIDCN